MAEPEKEELTEGEKSVALICQVAIGAFLGIFLARVVELFIVGILYLILK